eukprot:UN26146
MGWGDLTSYGHPMQERGAIDDLIDSGIKFTQWYSGESVCTPSRAALLTGRLPKRTGVYPIHENPESRVFLPIDIFGLPHEELTIPEMLKEKGYVTGMAGKWHLGINSFNNTDGVYLPKTHGFDMVGPTLPFSNHWLCDETKPSEKQNENCFIYNADRIIQQPIKHENLTHYR